jgi:phospholipid/cholesterol/gamma-HCH transport system substrate-binding protein
VRTAIRKHLRDFIAVTLIFLLAAGVAGYILSNQRFYLPAWVPVLGTDFYDLNAEFETAQAVVPGQGQTVNIAGVKVGDIGKVTLEDGRAVVEMKLESKYKGRVFKNATLLLRPKTGLKDMFIEMNPGTRDAGELPENAHIPVAQTKPDVNLDEILSNLDRDTRDYLQVLVNTGGEVFSSKRFTANLRETFKRFEPTNRDIAKITSEVGKRRRNLAHVIHNFQILSSELAKRDDQLSAFVDSANANFQALANQDQNLRAALRELPSTLDVTGDTLGKADELGRELGAATRELDPFAKDLGPALRATRPFLRNTTPVIRDQLRPFSREVRPTVRTLRRTAADLAVTTPRLVTTFKFINKLLNALAYNPPGQEEGYLFWTSWLSHAGASLFSTQDANGPIRRGIVITNCTNLGVLEQIGKTNPNLQVLTDLLHAPPVAQVCPQQTPSAPVVASREKKAER